MTNSQSAGSLDALPASDVPALLERCRGRILEREGIAMFVALHDARPGRQAQVATDAASEGSRLAVLFDHYREGLTGSAPTREADHDPTGASALIDVLVVLSDQHLRAVEEVES